MVVVVYLVVVVTIGIAMTTWSRPNNDVAVQTLVVGTGADWRSRIEWKCIPFIMLEIFRGRLLLISLLR